MSGSSILVLKKDNRCKRGEGEKERRGEGERERKTGRTRKGKKKENCPPKVLHTCLPANKITSPFLVNFLYNWVSVESVLGK
jgi:hypothetical protein